MDNQSLYDPTRKTVGATYLDAQKNNTEDFIEVGDMARELMSSLVSDLNDTIKSNPYDNKPFFITIHEKRDLQMKNAFMRRILTTLYRPYPEDDTVVFWTNPVSNEILFCWCLPHWSEMDNMLNNELLYDKNQIAEIKAWKLLDLYHFGFTKDPIGNWMPNPAWKDKSMNENKVQILMPA